MNNTRVYKKSKKQTVQLTSLLDLLFVMIFVSLIQQKEVVKPTPKPVKKPVAKVTPKPKVKPITKTPPKPEKIVHTINAEFNFYGSNSKPNIPSGKYAMQGSYNKKTGELRLGGIYWIQRPPQYDMVPLSGKVDANGDTFIGRVESIGCQKFTLSRKAKGSTTPISGQWVGTYNCSQGDTGLTLTIK